jgi:hypothetical protein
MRFRILFQQKNPVDQAHGSVDCGRTAVYGGPGPAVAEGLAGARVWGRFGEWKVAGSGEKEEEASGVPIVGEGGRCSARGRPAMVDHNGGGLELVLGQVEARRGETESGMRCGGVLQC